MTNAVPIRIADAVAAEINAAVEAEEFQTLDFTAQRRYADWDEEFGDLNDMAVDVVFVSHQRTTGMMPIRLESAGFLGYEPTIDIAIRKRFESGDRDIHTGRLKNEAVDPLVTLLQEIHELFVSGRNSVPLDDETEANWVESDVLSWVNQRKLREGLFEGAVRIKFNFRKAI